MKMSPFFVGFVDNELEIVADHVKKMQFSKGHTVFNLNGKRNFFYLVNSGKFKARLKNGKEVKYQVGDVFGEIPCNDEYARLGTVYATENSEVFTFPTNLLINPKKTPYEVVIKVQRSIITNLTKYIHEFRGFGEPIKYFVEQGEGLRIEYKSAINEKTFEEILQTCVAFMNTNGGVVLIGVHDLGKIVGIPALQLKQAVERIANLMNTGAQRVGDVFTSNVRAGIVRVGKKSIARIDCVSSENAVFLRSKGKRQFWVRMTAANKEMLDFEKVIDYMLKRKT